MSAIKNSSLSPKVSKIKLCVSNDENWKTMLLLGGVRAGPVAPESVLMECPVAGTPRVHDSKLSGVDAVWNKPNHSLFLLKHDLDQPYSIVYVFRYLISLTQQNLKIEESFLSLHLMGIKLSLMQIMFHVFLNEIADHQMF